MRWLVALGLLPGAPEVRGVEVLSLGPSEPPEPPDPPAEDVCEVAIEEQIRTTRYRVVYTNGRETDRVTISSGTETNELSRNEVEC